MPRVDPVDVLIKVVNDFFEERQHPNAVRRAAITGPYLIQLTEETSSLLMSGDTLDKLNEALAKCDFGKVQCGVNNRVIIPLGGRKQG